MMKAGEDFFTGTNNAFIIYLEYLKTFARAAEIGSAVRF